MHEYIARGIVGLLFLACALLPTFTRQLIPFAIRMRLLGFWMLFFTITLTTSIASFFLQIRSKRQTLLTSTSTPTSRPRDSLTLAKLEYVMSRFINTSYIFFAFNLVIGAFVVFSMSVVGNESKWNLAALYRESAMALFSVVVSFWKI
ncbi:hypothetical protein HK102_014113 [Quaeritorhiza haematococci]|nr:hypothetical protein HK102_014113 [Quaeritorhiza haematococci]